MRDGDAVFGPFDVPWFDGGLFDDDSVLPLSEPLLRRLSEAAKRDWAELDPSIMGTLFERGLDPDKRGQLGKFYTDRDKILLIVEPVITRPLAAEWRAVKERIAAPIADAERSRGKTAEAKGAEARALYHAHLERLRRFRVLDPACGSGNFLDLALQALEDLEWRALIEAEELGLGQELRTSRVSPRQMLGIEINDYACELARASVWIADIQWLRRRGLGVERRPILEKLETIECRDALVDPDGNEAAWPEADVIIGNPPFLGGKLLRNGLGDAVVDRLFAVYDGRVPREADLVSYWIAKAAAALAAGPTRRVGLVATNSIRGGANRKVLDRVTEQAVIFEAWSDEPWYQGGGGPRLAPLPRPARGPGGADAPARRPLGIHDSNRSLGRHGGSHQGGAAAREHGRRLHGRHQRRRFRRFRRTGARMATPAAQSQWPAQQRRAQTLDERARRHAPSARHVDHRLRVGA